MPSSVCYHAYSSVAYTTAINAAVVPIVKPGRITAIHIQFVGVGGASGGDTVWDVTKNAQAGGSATPYTTNNPQRESLVASLHKRHGASEVVTESRIITNISIPVSVGDNINVGCLLTGGTALAQGILGVNIYVAE